MSLARFRPHLLVALTLALTLAMLAQPPIPQPLSYHRFADTRTLLGVANFWNVASNLPFLLVGVSGLAWWGRHRQSIAPPLRTAWAILWLGVALVGLGSSWYHLAPANPTLVWDRLPMTIAFMAFFAIILAGHVDSRLSKLLWPMLVAGVLSVVYWQRTDDLRLYALVQFLPVLLIPLVLLLYPRKGGGAVWAALGFYLLAKLLEHFDPQIHAALGQQMSGHSLKHIAAAAGMYALLVGLRARHSASIQPSAPVPG